MTLKFSFSFFVTIACSVLLAGLLSSCSSSKKIRTDYIYFQNGSNIVVSQQKETVIQSNDLLNIQVYSRTLNQEQAAIFNIPATSSNNINNSILQGYQVNIAGNIEIPVIGSVKAAGLTKEQLQTELAEKLTNYVKNPSVIVRFLQFNVNVLGEVRAPGIQRFNVDKVTIIDALTSAGDLTDYARREDITVIREEAGKKAYYTVDMRSKAIFESPVYILQPNDIIYVSPNKYKLKNLSFDPDVQRKTGIITTIISLALSVTTVILYITRT